MKSDSKLYRFFLGERGTRGLPTVANLIVLVPFLVFGFFFGNNKRENLSNNPVSTRVAIEEVYSVGNEVDNRRKDGRGFDWDSNRSRSFDTKKTDWRQTIGIIRNILEPTINETDR